MAFQITEVPGKPILMIVPSESIDPQGDLFAAIQAVRQYYEKIKQPFYYLNDLRAMPLTFDQLTDLLSMMRGQFQGLPVTFVFVGTSNLAKLGATALKQRQYGGWDVVIFATLEEAMTYIDDQLATGKG